MPEVVREVSEFKGKIIKWSLVITVIIGVLSLFFLGFDKHFFLGLFLGVLVTILNFNLLVWQGLSLTGVKKPRAASYFGYFIRLLLYGFVFYLTIRISYLCGFGALLGFLSQKIAIFFVYMILPKFAKKEENPGPPKQYRDLSGEEWPEDPNWIYRKMEGNSRFEEKEEKDDRS